jgi:VanZ family protein
MARAAGWLLIAFVVFATLSPIVDRPTTPAGANWERLVAFALIGACFALGYARWRVPIIGALIAIAGLLEAGQNLTPDRHGRLSDFLVKGAGLVLGAVLVAGFGALRRGYAPAPVPSDHPKD